MFTVVFILSFPFPFSTVGQLLKAAETAATYLGLKPSDEVMLNNVRYYINKYKLQSEDFLPREVSSTCSILPYMHPQ